MLPSTVTFAAGDRTYIASLNALIADMNALYTSFLATTAGAFFKATSTTSATIGHRQQGSIHFGRDERARLCSRDAGTGRG